MGKNILRGIRAQGIWLFLLLCTDGLAGVLLWLADVRSFFVLLTVLALGTVLLFFAALLWTVGREQKKEQTFLAFLTNPDEQAQERAVRAAQPGERERICAVGELLRREEQMQKAQNQRLTDYEEYVESWAHEIKTPLSLLTFLLDNRRGQMEEGLYVKLEYVRAQTQELVDKMLAFARLKSSAKDYQFEPLALEDLCQEVLQEYHILLRERGFQVENQVSDRRVITDGRAFSFLLGQVIANALKYAKEEERCPRIWLFDTAEDERIYLHVQDNGIGVKLYDLPFLFEKGFTGDTGAKRKKATGMGLYLVKMMAEDLNITVHAAAEDQRGFEIVFGFPIVS